MTSKYALYTENITHHALFGVFISLCLMLFDFVIGCSFLAGSFVYLLPQIWFRYAFFSNQRLDKQITLKDLYKSMFSKMILIAVLFALCFSFERVRSADSAIRLFDYNMFSNDPSSFSWSYT